MSTRAIDKDIGGGRHYYGLVFPTLVGVFPCPASPMWRCTSLPHAEARAFQPDTSSPRSWGCFLL